MKQHARKVMYAAEISVRGVKGMYFVFFDTKVKRLIFIEKFLEP
jgi:hypothetical protein